MIGGPNEALLTQMVLTLPAWAPAERAIDAPNPNRTFRNFIYPSFDTMSRKVASKKDASSDIHCFPAT